jgi:CheY-like chemotaxis protein
MNGIEASREIRKLENERGQISATIIALTGVASSSVREEAISSGMNLFLTKPVSFKELQRILSEWTPTLKAQAP